jgi:SAM-dependent methyltransferase
MKDSSLSQLQRQWQDAGASDPLYAVLTSRGREGGKWNEEEFFRTGVAEIEALLAKLESAGLSRASWSKVLDFGCGVGRLSRALASHFESVTGVDIAPSMIAKAQDLAGANSRCRFVLNTSDDLSAFPAGHFDLIYSNIVLQHMPPRFAKKYIREFIRVLAPGGAVVFQLPTGPAWTIRGMIFRFVPVSVIRLARTRDMYAIKQAEVERLVAEAGGTVAHVWDDRFAGPNWMSKTYVVTKRG